MLFLVLGMKPRALTLSYTLIIIFFLRHSVSLNCTDWAQTLVPSNLTSQSTKITGICYHTILNSVLIKVQNV